MVETETSSEAYMRRSGSALVRCSVEHGISVGSRSAPVLGPANVTVVPLVPYHGLDPYSSF